MSHAAELRDTRLEGWTWPEVERRAMELGWPLVASQARRAARSARDQSDGPDPTIAVDA